MNRITKAKAHKGAVVITHEYSYGAEEIAARIRMLEAHIARMDEQIQCTQAEVASAREELGLLVKTTGGTAHANPPA